MARETEFFEQQQSGNIVIEDRREKIIDRLAKLLRLSKSDNEQEAQSAAGLK